MAQMLTVYLVTLVPCKNLLTALTNAFIDCAADFLGWKSNPALLRRVKRSWDKAVATNFFLCSCTQVQSFAWAMGTWFFQSGLQAALVNQQLYIYSHECLSLDGFGFTHFLSFAIEFLTFRLREEKTRCLSTDL